MVDELENKLEVTKKDTAEEKRRIREETVWPEPESTTIEEKVDYLHKIMAENISNCTSTKFKENTLYMYLSQLVI